jgi:hypothetical protein
MDKALCVGINRYPYPNVLHGCINDVNDVKAELVHALNFAPGNIVLVQDREATAEGIKAALNHAVTGLNAGDRFLFWYSGHGSQLVDGDAATDVICPVDFDGTAATSVTVQDFHDAFSKIPAGVVAVWGSDSCHSGDLEKDFYSHGVPKMFRRDPAAHPRRIAAHVRTFKDISAQLPNIALISGCRSDQTSADAYINGRYNGAFTYYALQTLRAPGGLSLLLTPFVTQVHTALESAHYAQMPQLSGPPSEVARRFMQQGAAH